MSNVNMEEIRKLIGALNKLLVESETNVLEDGDSSSNIKVAKITGVITPSGKSTLKDLVVNKHYYCIEENGTYFFIFKVSSPTAAKYYLDAMWSL